MDQANDSHNGDAPCIAPNKGSPAFFHAIHLEKKTQSKQKGKEGEEFSGDQYFIQESQNATGRVIVFLKIFTG